MALGNSAFCLFCLEVFFLPLLPWLVGLPGPGAWLLPRDLPACCSFRFGIPHLHPLTSHSLSLSVSQLSLSSTPWDLSHLLVQPRYSHQLVHFLFNCCPRHRAQNMHTPVRQANPTCPISSSNCSPRTMVPRSTWSWCPDPRPAAASEVADGPAKHGRVAEKQKKKRRMRPGIGADLAPFAAAAAAAHITV